MKHLQYIRYLTIILRQYRYDAQKHFTNLRYIKIFEIPIAHLCAFAVHVDNGEHTRWQTARSYALTARDGTRSETGSETRIQVILTSVRSGSLDPDSKIGSVDFGFGIRIHLIWIRIRIVIQPKTLDPDPDPDQMNTDPQP